MSFRETRRREDFKFRFHLSNLKLKILKTEKDNIRLNLRGLKRVLSNEYEDKKQIANEVFKFILIKEYGKPNRKC